MEAHTAKQFLVFCDIGLTQKVDMREVVKAQRETGQWVWEETDAHLCSELASGCTLELYAWMRQRALIWNSS